MSKVCKDEFIREIANECEIPQTVASSVVNKMLYLLSDHLQKGDTILFTGFGTFSVQDVKPRKGRNLKTGETIIIPAKQKVKFQANESLSESVQRKIDLKKHKK